MASGSGDTLFTKLKKLIPVVRLMGGSPTEITDAERQAENDTEEDKAIPSFSRSELDHINSVTNKQNELSEKNVSNLLSSITQTSGNMKDEIVKNKMIDALNPELSRAATIYTSSIQAPNTLQTGSVGISLSDSDLGLDESKTKAVMDVINDFFNEEFELGYKLPEWIRGALFEYGAKPVMILPRNITDNLVTSESQNEDGILNNEVTMEGWAHDTDGFNFDLGEAIDDWLFNTESTTPSYNVLTESAKDIVKNVKKEAGSYMTVSSDFNGFVDSSKKKNQSKNDEVTKNIKTRNGDMAIINQSVNNKEEEHARPIVVELPATSVVPVTVPGSSTTHIGYFVLVDEWNNPLNASSQMYSSSQMAEKRPLNQAFSTMVGTSVDNRIKGMDKNSKWDFINTSLDIAIQSMMKQCTDDSGYSGLSFGQTNIISNCMLYRALKKKKTKLIFVPEPFMMYYCFDYHEDGTGKSIIEDLRPILTLRSVWLIASLMATINNAIPHRSVTVDAGDENANPENMIDLVKRIYRSKNSLNFDDPNPTSIYSGMQENALTIIPKNLPGLEGDIEVEKSNENESKSTLDSDVREMLGNMIVTGLGIPYSAVNELSDTEYSRSVATVNLIFSNNIRGKQKPVNRCSTKLIRCYTSLSKELRDKIRDAITDNSEDDNTNNENPDNTDSVLNKIIESIQVVLPEPNISTAKTQFEELSERVSSISDLIDALVDDDMYPGDDRDASEYLSSIKAFMKADMVRDYIQTSGNTAIDAPDVKQFLTEHPGQLHELQQMIYNVKKGIEDRKTVLSGEAEEDDSGDGGSSYGSW